MAGILTTIRESWAEFLRGDAGPELRAHGIRAVLTLTEDPPERFLVDQPRTVAEPAHHRRLVEVAAAVGDVAADHGLGAAQR